MFVLIITVLLLVVHQGQCLMNATVTLYPNDLFLESGSLTFTQENADSPVRIVGTITGLNPDSAHGFHIHLNPVSEGAPNCTAAGPHFNPYNTAHGPPTADIDNRHVGDLGNITTDSSGTATVDITDSIIQLYNDTQSIANRSVVVHKLRDDGGEGGFLDSNTTGNAGARLLCGLIVLSNEDPSTTTVTTPASTSTGSTTTPPATTTAGNTTLLTTTNTGAYLQPVAFIFMIIMTVSTVILT